MKLKGDKAVTNFPLQSTEAKEEKMESALDFPSPSPTSVLRSGMEQPSPFDDWFSGDVDVLGMSVDSPLFLTNVSFGFNIEKEEQFKEFDPADFMLDSLVPCL